MMLGVSSTALAETAVELLQHVAENNGDDFARRSFDDCSVDLEQLDELILEGDDEDDNDYDDFA